MNSKEFFLYWFCYTAICGIVIAIAVADSPSPPKRPTLVKKTLESLGIGLLFLSIPGVLCAPYFIIRAFITLVKKKKEGV